MDLNTIWFLVMGLLLGIYVLLDGYDLGIGVLSLFSPDEKKRQAYHRLVAPYWDANEVWLITFGAVLFSVFAPVYAGLFSGFYLQVYLLLVTLIMRALSVELRNKSQSPAWRRTCDILFGVGSLLIPLLLGVVGGNLLYGLPVDVKRDITPSFWSTLNPFALLAGITTVALVAMHGAVYAALKSPTALQNDLRKPAIGAWVLAVALAVALEIYVALATQSPWRANHHSWLALAGLVLAASSAAVPVYVLANKWVKAFIATSLFLASVLALFGLQMYPVLVKSTNGADLDLTIYNSASSDNTMITMLVISAILLPVVIAYKAYIYYTLSTSGTDHADY